MKEWPFGDLRPFGYRALLLDPAWQFVNWSEKGESKGANAQYRTMSLDELRELPVAHLAHPDHCGLVMWATFPMLPQALGLMEHYGFEYVTGGAWGKQSSTGNKWNFGTGYRLRTTAELFLVGTMAGKEGKPPWKSKSTRNFIAAPIRGHSRKPDRQYEIVEELFDGPYAELFSRASREGWDAWGDEAGKFDDEAG